MKQEIIKTGLYGGTFNPPHLGHLFVAETVFREFNLDEIIFIPVGDPPHKTNIKIAFGTQRIEMLKLMTENYSFMNVSDVEINRKGYTYTVDTLKIMKEISPNRDFYYIIGSDTLFQLKTWRSFTEVFSLTKFICIKRPGDSEESICSEIASLKREYGADILISSFYGPDISSSEIRNEILNGIDSGKTDKKVMEYIIKNDVFKR